MPTISQTESRVAMLETCRTPRQANTQFQKTTLDRLVKMGLLTVQPGHRYVLSPDGVEYIQDAKEKARR